MAGVEGLSEAVHSSRLGGLGTHWENAPITGLDFPGFDSDLNEGSTFYYGFKRKLGS